VDNNPVLIKSHLIKKLIRPPWRTIVPACGFLIAAWGSYLFWTPGLEVLDGRNDLGRNGVWLAHGWLGGNEWFVANGKTNQISQYRNVENVRTLANKLHRYHITDVFPHLCPAGMDGSLPAIDPEQVERFLDEFESFKVIPWIGGPNSSSALIHKPSWRSAFATNVNRLLSTHPRLAGVQINVEPLPNGDADFLNLLEEVHRSLPKGKILSVAAYPPPTRWHPFSDVHWDEAFFSAVARRSDQIAVMMYDAGQRVPKFYQRLMADWTVEVLKWSDGKPVLLGVPTYEDADVAYHRPNVENITNALLGINQGLSRIRSPAKYQGVAIYCDWETSDSEWAYFQEHFLNRNESMK
jgi:hypothetical protein